MKTNSFVELISIIKEKPAMYLGARTISNLKAFLDGWYLRSPGSVTDGEVMGAFQDYIEKKYDKEGAQSWAGIILYYSADEYEALESFFQLFDEFLNKTIKKVA